MADSKKHISLKSAVTKVIDTNKESIETHATVGTWSEVKYTGRAPSKRLQATMSAFGHRIFLYGGGSGGGLNKQDDKVYVLDTGTDVWSVPDIEGGPPAARQGHTAVAFENKLYIFGGFNQSKRERLNDTWALDTINMIWTPVDTIGEKPEPRTEHSSALIGDSMFIFGGSTGDVKNDMYSLNLKTRQWTMHNAHGHDVFSEIEERMLEAGESPDEIKRARLEAANAIPCPRKEACMEELHGRFHVVGGVDNRGNLLHDIHSFSPPEKGGEEGEWRAPHYGHPHILGVRKASLTKVGDILYLFGGQNHGATYNPTDSLYCYNPLNESRWLMYGLGEKPAARSGHAACDCQGDLFIFGGYSAGIVADMFRFHPTAPDKKIGMADVGKVETTKVHKKHT